MRTVIGIDVGGSTTKIVGFQTENGKRKLIEPQFVRATDAITSVYGAFGKFTMQNNLALYLRSNRNKLFCISHRVDRNVVNVFSVNTHDIYLILSCRILLHRYSNTIIFLKYE